MANSYAVNPKRNKFVMKWSHHLTMKLGKAIPAFCMEFNPGDSFKIDMNQLIRMMPLQSPTMSNIKCRIDFFRVDNHLIFDKWLDFIKQTGDEENPIVMPYREIPSGGYEESSLMDYLGITPKKGAGMKISMLSVRAYNLIMNKYYINSNLQDEVEFSMAEGLDTTTPVELRSVNWKRDRFGSAQTSRQRGGDVILPIGQKAPVIAYHGVKNDYHGALKFRTQNGEYNDSENRYLQMNNAGDVFASWDKGSYIADIPLAPENLLADLRSATGVSLSALSIAKTMQHLRQISLFAGEHYPDWQYANWGVKSSDARLQNPEWLGGMKWNFITSEVLQTSETTSNSVQGTMAGHGFSTGGNSIYVPYLDGYGFIMGILTVMPEPEYQQGIDKMFLRHSNFDYVLPLLTHMPMQEIKNCELFLQDNSVVNGAGKPVNDDAFGYEPIYDDFRYRVNRTSGGFRTSLSHWLLNRIFDNMPKLNESFVKADKVPMGIFAVDPNTVDPLLCDFRFKVTALRKLPKIGLPIF